MKAGDWPIFGRDAPDVAWRPDPDAAFASRLADFLRLTGEPSLDSLQTHAVADPAWFWGAAADDLAIAWARRPRTILDASGGPAWTRWWLGGSFDWSWAAVEPRAARDPDGVAIVWEGEDGTTRELSNRALAGSVRTATRRLAELGIGEGDRVGILLPMVPETVIAVLAVSRLGAIFTPIFSGYAAPAIASRLADCGARLLITADGFLRRGAWVDLKAVADAAVAMVPTVEHVLVVRRAARHLRVAWTDGRDQWWGHVPEDEDGGTTSPGSTPAGRDPETPYLLIYTSGTTGRPKGAVHVHGGFPIKAAQDLAHTFDLTDRDTLLWFTDLGWMMGPWAIAGALLLGARLVLYEGAPDFPGPDRLWSLVARHRVTHLGLSPTVIRALMAHGEEPVRSHDRSSLRVLGSTGEPWNPEPWWWYFREVGEGRCPIVNYSGGTEVSGGIVGGNVVGPIKPVSLLGAVHRDRGRRGRRRWVTAPWSRRRAGDPGGDAGDDARVLARPRALRGDVLVALAGRLGARRLGVDRRGRLLVHPRALGRHAQGRGQAGRAGRGRERGRGPPRGAGGGGDRRPARDQG